MMRETKKKDESAKKRMTLALQTKERLSGMEIETSVVRAALGLRARRVYLLSYGPFALPALSTGPLAKSVPAGREETMVPQEPMPARAVNRHGDWPIHAWLLRLRGSAEQTLEG
jgi:hypothetical protein